MGEMLTFDDSTFRFSDSSNEKSNDDPVDDGGAIFTDISYGCMTDFEFDHIVKLPGTPRVEAHVKFTAKFKEKTFVKYVWCKNIVRLKGNTIARSALDLVGKTLIWDTTETYEVPDPTYSIQKQSIK